MMKKLFRKDRFVVEHKDAARKADRELRIQQAFSMIQ